METSLTATRVEWHMLALCIRIKAIQTTAVSDSSLQHAAPLLHLLQAAALRTLCQALVPDSTRFPVTQVGWQAVKSLLLHGTQTGAEQTLPHIHCSSPHCHVGSHLPAYTLFALLCLSGHG